MLAQLTVQANCHWPTDFRASDIKPFPYNYTTTVTKFRFRVVWLEVKPHVFLWFSLFNSFIPMRDYILSLEWRALQSSGLRRFNLINENTNNLDQPPACAIQLKKYRKHRSQPSPVRNISAIHFAFMARRRKKNECVASLRRNVGLKKTHFVAIVGLSHSASRDGH